MPWQQPLPLKPDASLMSAMSSAFSSLTFLVRHIPADRLAGLQLDLVRYLLEAGLVPHAARLLGTLKAAGLGDSRGGHGGREEALRLLGKTLSLLEAVASFPCSSASSAEAASTADTAQQQASFPLGREVVEAFRSTQMAGELPTLSSLLVEERPSGGYDVQDISPQVLSLAWLVLRTLNHLCRLDLPVVQSLLASDELQSYFNYVYSMLLRVLASKLSSPSTAAMASTGEVESCLEQLLTLLGYYFLENGSSQHCIETSPILLNRLANLPIRYFCDEHYKDVLFPTLACLCYPSPANKAMLKNEMNTDLLVDYLDKRRAQRAAAAQQQQPHSPPAKPSAGSQPVQGWVLLARRFPLQHWDAAASFFAE